MTTTVLELPDRFEFQIDGRPIGYVMRFVIEGLLAHDGGAHQLRPARSLMEECERRQERRDHPHTEPDPF